MKKKLYDTETAKLLPYPRQDGEPVAGLAAHLVPVEIIDEPRPAYDPATQKVEQIKTADLEAGTYTYGWSVIDLTPEEIAERLAASIAAIKAEASARILAVLPDWRQRNMLARSVELLEIRESGEILTAAELRELDAIRNAWSWARSVRACSDQLEALVAQGEAVDPATAEWPVFRP